MDKNVEYSFNIKTSLSEDEFYTRLLNYFDKNTYYYIIPDWLALKLNKFGDSGLSRGEVENRAKRSPSSPFGITSKKDFITLLNITGWQTKLGSYNFTFSVAKNGSSYEIKGKIEATPNLTLMMLTPFVGFILGLLIFPQLILLTTVPLPLIYFIFARQKLLSDVSLPKKNINDYFINLNKFILTGILEKN